MISTGKSFGSTYSACAEPLPCPKVDLAASPKVGKRQVRVAVCVCSYGRPTLDSCLGSILAQNSDARFSPHVVFVDNTPDGRLQAATASALRNSRHVTIVHESNPGIPLARNAALDAAKRIGADHIAFIDDDEIAPANWLSTLYSALTSTGADVAQGALIRAGTLKEAIGKARAHFDAPGAAQTRERRTASTNNVIFRAWLINGPLELDFDEALAKVGGSDADFFMRAGDAGARIVRTSGAPVFEVWEEKRLSPRYACKRAWRVGASTNYRYRKNRTALFAAAILLGRGTWRFMYGGAFIAASLLWRPFNGQKSDALFNKGTSSVCFGAGCLTPFVSLRPTEYY